MTTTFGEISFNYLVLYSVLVIFQFQITISVMLSKMVCINWTDPTNSLFKFGWHPTVHRYSNIECWTGEKHDKLCSSINVHSMQCEDLIDRVSTSVMKVDTKSAIGCINASITRTGFKWKLDMPLKLFVRLFFYLYRGFFLYSIKDQALFFSLLSIDYTIAKLNRKCNCNGK